MRKTGLIAGILALSMLFLMAGCSNKEEEPETVLEPGTAVEVSTVSRGNISTENSISGSVIAGTTESVYVSLSARISNVYVEAGDTVTAGQTICVVDLGSFRDNYDLASLNYQTAQKNYQDQAELFDKQIAQLEKNYYDTLALYEIGAASQAEVDAAKLNWDSTVVTRNTTLSQLEVSMKNSQTTMDQVSDTLKNINGNGTITAPISGTIISLNAAKDNFVSAGMPVAVIESTSDRKIEISVSEALISKISVGDGARVTVNALGESFDSYISDISISANAMTHLYSVNLAIPSDVYGILSGMFVDVVLYTDSREDTVVIPTEAILVDDYGQYVVTLDSQNLAHRVSVEVGLVGDGISEILSGLSGGETLVVVGQSYLAEGDLARIVSAEG